MPGEVFRDEAAQNRPQDGRKQCRQCPQHHRFASLLARISREQERLGERHHRSAGNALNDAHEHQHPERPGKPAQQRTQREQADARDQHAHGPESLRQPPGERHDDGFGYCIRGDDPSPLAGRDGKAPGNGRQRYVGDGEIQDHHEVDQRQRNGAED